MLLHEGQEALIQSLGSSIHASVDLHAQGGVLKLHRVKGEVDAPVVQRLGALDDSRFSASRCIKVQPLYYATQHSTMQAVKPMPEPIPMMRAHSTRQNACIDRT